MKDQNVSKKSKCVLFFYFVFTFYYFGVVVMTYFVSYPQMQKITKNVQPYMQLFNEKMIWFCYLPAILMVVSALFLVIFRPKLFLPMTLWPSLALALLSVSTTFFVIIPIHNALPSTGLSSTLGSQLFMRALYFQVIPAAIQVAIAVGMLYKYMSGSSVVSRLLFTAVFFLSIYSWGTLYIESLVGYPMWRLIDSAEWLATREAVGLAIPAFIWVFLIPVYLPLLLLIPMFWTRPKGVSKYSVLLFFVALLWVFIITAAYFVPDIQQKLTTGYSRSLIEDLNDYDFPLRGIPDLIYFITVCYMFLKVERTVKQDIPLTATNPNR
jgi:hypothetical protein